MRRPRNSFSNTHHTANGDKRPSYEKYRALLQQNGPQWGVVSDTKNPAQTSGIPGPHWESPLADGQESQQAELKRVSAFLLRPDARPVIDALLVHPTALIQAASTILGSVHASTSHKDGLQADFSRVVSDLPSGTETQMLPQDVTETEFFNVIAPPIAKLHQKYIFPPELLDNPKALSAAKRIANSRNYKKKNNLQLSSAENEQAKVAESFVKQALRRRKRMELTPQ